MMVSSWAGHGNLSHSDKMTELAPKKMAITEHTINLEYHILLQNTSILAKKNIIIIIIIIIISSSINSIREVITT